MGLAIGDDAETTGAVYGHIAGAYYGEGGLTTRWRSILIKKDLIRMYADQIIDLSRSFAG